MVDEARDGARGGWVKTNVVDSKDFPAPGGACDLVRRKVLAARVSFCGGPHRSLNSGEQVLDPRHRHHGRVQGGRCVKGKKSNKAG